MQEGYEANKNGKELIKPITDGFICDLIAQAKASDRIAPAQSVRELALSTKKIKGRSEYGQNPTTNAVFGSSELAELNAEYLVDRGYEFGRVWDWKAQELEKLLDKEDNVIVRAVGLGDVYWNYIYFVGAFVYFGSNSGRARSVVHVDAQKISPQERKVPTKARK